MWSPTGDELFYRIREATASGRLVVVLNLFADIRARFEERDRPSTAAGCDVGATA